MSLLQKKDDQKTLSLQETKFKQLNQEIKSFQIPKICLNTENQSKYYQQYQKTLLKSIKTLDDERIFRSLLANGIRVIKSNNNQRCAIEILQQNSQATVILVKLRMFELELKIIEINSQSPLHYQSHVGRGSFGQVYKCQLQGKQYAFKCFTFDRNKMQSQKLLSKQLQIFRNVIHQYSIAKILSIIGVGVGIQKFCGFDLYVCQSCIEFGMNFHKQQTNIQNLKFDQLIQKLHKMHCLNIVHRDIKPQNLVFDSQTQSWLFCDFGVSQNINQQPGQLSSLPAAGTLGYIIPEVYKLLQKKIPVDHYYNDLFAIEKTISSIEQRYKNQQTILKFSLRQIPINQLLDRAEKMQQKQMEQFFQLSEGLGRVQHKLTDLFCLLKIKHAICYGTVIQLRRLQQDKSIHRVIKKQKQNLKAFLRQSPRVNQIFQYKLQQSQIIIFEGLENLFFTSNAESGSHKKNGRYNQLFGVRYFLQKTSKFRHKQEQIQHGEKRFQMLDLIFNSEKQQLQKLSSNISIEECLCLYIELIWDNVWSQLDLKLKYSNKLLKLLQNKKLICQKKWLQIKNPLKVVSMYPLYICLQFIGQFFKKRVIQVKIVIKTIIICFLIFRDKQKTLKEIDDVQKVYNINSVQIDCIQLNLDYLRILPSIFSLNIYEIVQWQQRRTKNNINQNIKIIQQKKQELVRKFESHQYPSQDISRLLKQYQQQQSCLKKMLKVNSQMHLPQNKDYLVQLSRQIVNKKFVCGEDYQKLRDNNIIIYIENLVGLLCDQNFRQLNEQLNKFDYSKSKINNNIFHVFRYLFLKQCHKYSKKFVELASLLKQEKQLIRCDEYFFQLNHDNYTILQAHKMNYEQTLLFLNSLLNSQDYSQILTLQLIIFVISFSSQAQVTMKKLKHAKQLFNLADKIIFSQQFLVKCKKSQLYEKKVLAVYMAKYIYIQIETISDLGLQKIQFFINILIDIFLSAGSETEINFLKGVFYYKNRKFTQTIYYLEKALTFTRQFYISDIIEKLSYAHFSLCNKSQIGFAYLQQSLQIMSQQQYFSDIQEGYLYLFTMLDKFVERQRNQLIFRLFRHICLISFRKRSKLIISNIIKVFNYFITKSSLETQLQLLFLIARNFKAKFDIEQSHLCLIMYQLVKDLQLQKRQKIKMFRIMIEPLSKSSLWIKQHILNTYFNIMYQLNYQKRKKSYLLNQTAKYAKCVSNIRKYHLKNYPNKRYIVSKIKQCIQSKINLKFK